MKISYLLTLLYILIINGMLFGQNNPIDFESGGYGATWTWAVFENDTDPQLEIVANPSISGINTSATVAKFTALQMGQPFAGCETMHGSDIGTFTLNASNSTIKMMVYKSVVSDVGIKFALPNGAALPEIKVANTLTNQWEELTFDFSGRIGDPNTIGQDQIIIFPDFDLVGRTSDNIIYFDNITFSARLGPTVPAPTPTVPANDVISIFSDAYTNLEATDFNPNWEQSTVVSQVFIQGDTTLLYTGLNYQGIELGSSQDVSGMGYLHVDFWTANSTDLGVFLISPGPVETEVLLVPPGTTENWVSVDIPLTAFSPVDLTDVFQFKFDGNGDIYLDNLYFFTSVSDVKELHGSVPSDYTLEQNYPNPFNPTTNIRFNLPEANQVILKLYNMLGQEVATLLNEYMNAGTFEVSFGAAELPSGTYVYSISTGPYKSFKKMVLIK